MKNQKVLVTIEFDWRPLDILGVLAIVIAILGMLWLAGAL